MVKNGDINDLWRIREIGTFTIYKNLLEQLKVTFFEQHRFFEILGEHFMPRFLF